MNIRNITLFCVLMSFVFQLSTAQAARDYYYQTYYESLDPQKKPTKIVNEFNIEVGDLKDGKRLVKWVKNEDNITALETYILDKDWATLEWEVDSGDGKTKYKGRRQGNEIIVTGQFEGKAVNRTIKIDAAPLYFNPKVSLTGFIESKNNQQDFWGIRQDTLEEYKMQANLQGEEGIYSNGQLINAIKVYWAPKDGIAAKFFKRTYWYRKSDGIYLKQKVIGSLVRCLIKES